MSDCVIVTQTTTTTTTSALIINTGYLKTRSGILKVSELILGITTVGLLSYTMEKYSSVHTPEVFFLLMAVNFMVGTFLLLLSCIISISTPKTIYEVIYHGFACLMLAATSLYFIIEVSYKRNFYSSGYQAYFAAAILELLNSLLYLLSTIFARRSYKVL